MSSSDVNAVVDTYVDKLILQYHDKPRARATIAILLKQAVADCLAASLETCFNLGVAVGPQLDTLGKYIGVPRDVGPVISVPYFGFLNYDGTGNTIGWRDYPGDSNLTGVWETYQDGDGQNTDLNDLQYNLVLQLKIILNANDGTNASIMAYLNEFFPGQVQLIDHADMTAEYLVSPAIPLDPTTLAAFLPKPMGVGITVGTLGPGSSGNLVSSGGDQLVDSAGDDFVTSP